MKIYIIWNKVEDRPAIGVCNFGPVIAYLTKEQAEAYLWTCDARELLEIKLMELKTYGDARIEELKKENQELAKALLMMYEQYCDEGHECMSAGETASAILERQGYAKFDITGRIIQTKNH